MEKSVTIILVTYNSAGVVGKALASVIRHPSIYEIIVVDNASSDGTCVMIQRDYPQVTLIQNPINDGYGRANNIGLAKVATPYALLLNPDAVLHEGALDGLLRAAEAYPDAAIVAPLILDAKGAIYPSHKRNVFIREQSRGAAIVPEGDCCAEFLSGAVWLLKMEHLQKVGFFDPAIFLYYEDDDLCLRTRQACYGLVLAHQAKATHMMGGSSGAHSPEAEYFKQSNMQWSRLYIEKKYRGDAAAQALAAQLRWRCAFWALYFTLTGNRLKQARYHGRLAGVKEFSAG